MHSSLISTSFLLTYLLTGRLPRDRQRAAAAAPRGTSPAPPRLPRSHVAVADADIVAAYLYVRAALSSLTTTVRTALERRAHRTDRH